jgi:hypothetical protein
MTFHDRDDWGAAPATGGPGQLTPSRVKGVVLHWPGSGETDSFDNDAEVAAALRGWQRFHQEDRGWSDIAYQRAFSQDGDVWELRGIRTQSGANGNNELNETYGAFLLILIAGEEPSDAMKASVRAAVAEFRQVYGDDAALILPHSAVRPDGTDCPGPKARAAIARGDFEPWADQPDTPDTEDDPFMALTDADAAKLGKAVADALSPRIDVIEQKYTVADNNYDSQRAAWEAVGQAYAAHLLAGGPALSADQLNSARDAVWSFYRPLWTKA